MSEESDYLNLAKGVYEVRGPAGAGKTYRLTHDVQKLARCGRSCTLISFSNAAVDELKARIGIDGVIARTIHSFVWMLIAPLSDVLLENPSDLSEFQPIAFRRSEEDLSWDSVSHLTYDSGIPFYNSDESLLSLGHNDVLDLFEYLLERMPIFAQLIVNSMDVLIIDEYQDTNRKFLKMVLDKLSSSILIGLYGDSCQKIYPDDSNSTSLDELLSTHGATRVPLTRNFRSDSSLVKYFNTIRKPFDGIMQTSEMQGHGGEMHVVIGDNELDDETRKKIIKQFSLCHAMTLSSTNYLALAAVNQGARAKELRTKVNKYRKEHNHGNLQWGDFLSLEPMTPELLVLNTLGELFSEHGYRQTQAVLKCFSADSIHSMGLKKIDELIIEATKEEPADIISYFKKFGVVWREGFSDYDLFIQSMGIKSARDAAEMVAALKKLTVSTTIFQAKGREYESVILNIDTGKYSQYGWKNIDFHNTESAGLVKAAMVYFLYYVGITRAKSQLVIYINRHTDKEFLEKFHREFSFDETEASAL